MFDRMIFDKLIVRRSLALFVLMASFNACSSGGDGAPTTTPPVTVTVTSVSLNTNTLALTGVGATGILEATVTTNVGVDNSAAVAWTSSAPGVATVSGTGRTGQIVSVSIGQTTITATSGGRSATATVTVAEAPRALALSITGTGAGRVVSSPAGADCGTGSSAGCAPMFAFNTAVTLTATASTGSAFDGWSGACTGTTTCVATMDAAKSVQASFRLLPVPVATVVVAPPAIKIAPGTTAQLVATTRDGSGATLTGRAISWSSADTNVAVVSTTGLVTARNTGGPINVTATSEGRSGSSAVTVESPFITAISLGLGFNSACAAEANGVTWCWGRNASGQLGTGVTSGGLGPVRVNTTQVFVEVDIASANACGRTALGSVYCWGSSSRGAIGTGVAIANEYVPALTAGGLVAKQISLSSDAGCALSTDGTPYCWGDNANGEIGVGVNGSAVRPTVVAGGTPFTQITSTGGSNSGIVQCAISATGVGFCWGNNGDGQLGDNSRIRRTAPTLVGGNHAFRSIAPGEWNSCGIDTNGAAWCWGSNTEGELGIGQFSGSTAFPLPQLVQTSLTFRSVTVGMGHSCALTADGTPYCWGLNQFGQLGDATTTNRSSPTPVVTSVKFSRLVARGYSTCGVAINTVVYCWGNNGFAQLGTPQSNGTSTPSAVPRP